jgi:hypothetical protein
MPEPVSLIMRQFLAWVGERPRRREEVREAWRSCPRISVWEDAVTDDLVGYDDGGLIGLTPKGEEALISSPDGAQRNPGDVVPMPLPRIPLRSMRATSSLPVPARRRAP